MSRLLICTLVCFMFTSSLQAQESRFASLWPFGKKKTPTSSSIAVNPFSKGAMTKTDKTLGLPSPTSLVSKAGKGTDTIVQKTKQTWKGMQDFTKSMNPFAKRERSPSRKPAWLSRLMPKPKTSSSPATVNDFLSMDRPKF